MEHVKHIRELQFALRLAFDWIDAVPKETVAGLESMPPLDRVKGADLLLTDQADRIPDLQAKLKSAFKWIDALPVDLVNAFPAMPGFDHDWAEGLLLESDKIDDSDEEVSGPSAA